MTTPDHPLLAKILASVSPTNAFNCHWGQLRREVFPGEDSWTRLKAWAAAHNLECELAFSQSSKGAEVQFRRLGRTAVIDAQNPVAEPALVAAAEDAIEEELEGDEELEGGEEDLEGKVEEEEVAE